MAQVLLEKVTKRFGSTEVVHGIDAHVRDGEFLVIVGPSGCGKSTILRMIAGLEEITEGRVSIGDRVVNNLEPKDRNIAMVFQNYALYPHMSVFGNMAYGLKVRGERKQAIQTRVEEVASVLGLSDMLDRKPRQLSGGQRQRVAMGRAIVREPNVFLFDEPLSNLDAKLRNQMRVELKRLHTTFGHTSIYVTHDQVEAMTLADRIMVMRNGRMEQLATPHEIYTSPASTFVAGFIGSPTMNMLAGKVDPEGSTVLVSDNLRLDIQVPLPGVNGNGVIAGIRPEDLFRISDPDQVGFDTTVELVETLGSDTILHCRVKGHEEPLIVRLPGLVSLESGESVRFGCDFTRIHFFDPQTTMRIGNS